MKKIDELELKENYFEQEISGYVYIVLFDDYEEIVFSTREYVSFIDLRVFISPKIDRLSLGGDGENVIKKIISKKRKRKKEKKRLLAKQKQEQWELIENKKKARKAKQDIRKKQQNQRRK